MSVWVDDVDAVHRHCLEAGLEVTMPPGDQPWGAPVPLGPGNLPSADLSINNTAYATFTQTGKFSAVPLVIVERQTEASMVLSSDRERHR